LPKGEKIYLSFWIFPTVQGQYFGRNQSIRHDFEASTDAIISLRVESSKGIPVARKQHSSE
jgi:hypothetical protein